MTEKMCPLVSGVNLDGGLVEKPCLTHGCRFYTEIVGGHPQTGEPVHRWDCAVAWLPILTIENSQQQRQTGAAIESLRNEVVAHSPQQMIESLESLGYQVVQKKLITNDG